MFAAITNISINCRLAESNCNEVVMSRCSRCIGLPYCISNLFRLCNATSDHFGKSVFLYFKFYLQIFIHEIWFGCFVEEIFCFFCFGSAEHD